MLDDIASFKYPMIVRISFMSNALVLDLLQKKKIEDQLCNQILVTFEGSTLYWVTR